MSFLGGFAIPLDGLAGDGFVFMLFLFRNLRFLFLVGIFPHQFVHPLVRLLAELAVWISQGVFHVGGDGIPFLTFSPFAFFFQGFDMPQGDGNVSAIRILLDE